MGQEIQVISKNINKWEYAEMRNSYLQQEKGKPLIL